MLSIVTAMRATIGAGMVSTPIVANSWMRLVTAASPAISVNDSRLWSQNSDGPPKPRSLIMDSAKSKPNRSAFSTTVRLSSNEGMYCGDVVEISQPLLPIGMNTPSCMDASFRRELGRCWPVRRRMAGNGATGQPSPPHREPRRTPSRTAGRSGSIRRGGRPVPRRRARRRPGHWTGPAPEAAVARPRPVSAPGGGPASRWRVRRRAPMPSTGCVVERPPGDLQRERQAGAAEAHALRQRRPARDVPRRGEGRLLQEVHRPPRPETAVRGAGAVGVTTAW